MRSQASSLTDQGARILGIVAQDPSDVAQFLVRNPLPFPVLSDESRTAMQSYHVFNALNWDAFRVAHPSVFLIDPTGVVRWSYVASSQFDWPETNLVAAMLRRLQAS